MFIGQIFTRCFRFILTTWKISAVYNSENFLIGSLLMPKYTLAIQQPRGQVSGKVTQIIQTLNILFL